MSIELKRFYIVVLNFEFQSDPRYMIAGYSDFRFFYKLVLIYNAIVSKYIYFESPSEINHIYFKPQIREK